MCNGKNMAATFQSEDFPLAGNIMMRMAAVQSYDVRIYCNQMLEPIMRMKKRDEKAFGLVMMCLIFLVPLLILHFNIACLIPRINVTLSGDKNQENERSEVNTTGDVNPFPPPPFQSITGPPPQVSCDRKHRSYDLCTITGPTVMDPNASTFFLINLHNPSRPPEKVRPYPRKWENFTMTRIKELTLTSGPHIPTCEIRHSAPALVFSAGGYTGNFFHDFNDGLIPLYITVNSVFHDQDFVLVVSKARDWWVSKYRDILRTFSKHPIVNLDNDTSTHCFPSASIGLISHGFMTIDPKLIQSQKTLIHFRDFLAKAYEGGLAPVSKSRPRLVLAGRSGSGVGRVLMNQIEVKNEAEKVGFEVIVFEPTPRTPLREAYKLMNSSHAMVGVHGAALTHSLFLRPGSVLVQVVPLGAEWVSEVCFGNPAREMGLQYMEYRIGADESSLIDKYGEDDMIVRDPVGLIGNKWSHEIMNMYLKEQNVKLDLIRFRRYLEEAYKTAKRFMEKEG